MMKKREQLGPRFVSAAGLRLLRIPRVFVLVKNKKKVR